MGGTIPLSDQPRGRPSGSYFCPTLLYLFLGGNQDHSGGRTLGSGGCGAFLTPWIGSVFTGYIYGDLRLFVAMGFGDWYTLTLANKNCFGLSIGLTFGEGLGLTMGLIFFNLFGYFLQFFNGL